MNRLRLKEAGVDTKARRCVTLFCQHASDTEQLFSLQGIFFGVWPSFDKDSTLPSSLIHRSLGRRFGGTLPLWSSLHMATHLTILSGMDQRCRMANEYGRSGGDHCIHT